MTSQFSAANDHATGAIDHEKSRRSTVFRLGWGVADQAVSSLQNFLLGVYVARSLGAASLGALGLAFLAYAIILNASRGLSTDPLMVRYSGPPTARWRTAVASSSGVALLVGMAGGLACLGIGTVLRHALSQPQVGSAFFALGVGLPGLILQDSWRYAFFSSGQGRKALANDVFWTALLLPTLLIGQATGQSGVGWAMLAFGGTATVAAVFGMLQSRIVPTVRTARAWFRDQRDLGPRFLLENVTLGAGSQIRSVVVAAANGLVAVGAIRGAELLIGPIMALLMGVAQVAVPEAVRWLERGRVPFQHLCLMLSLGLASISIAWGAVILILFPAGIGHLLLGTVWPYAHVLILGVVVGATAGCMQVGPSAGLRALGRADRTLRTQLIVTSLYVLMGCVGAIIWGTHGTVWGVAIAATAGAVIWWYQLSLGLREHFAPPPAEPSQHAGRDSRHMVGRRQGPALTARLKGTR